MSEHAELFFLYGCMQAPHGLALGCVLRWRNPRYHHFMDGSQGARIEDEDLPFISCTPN